MSAFQTIADRIEALIPEGWNFTPYEPTSELPDVTTATLKIRTVTRLPAAPQGSYLVEWVLTVTSAYPSRERSDPELADDLLELLEAIDSAPHPQWVAWTTATKTVGDDLERLAYDINLITTTQKEA